jgi:hypothetical protein
LRLIDETKWDLSEAWAFLDNEASQAIEASKERSEHISTLYLVRGRGVAVLMGVLNAMFLWGQFALMGDRRLSIFYQLSHCQIAQIVNILFVSTPILAYFLFVGSWSLRQLNVFNGWYRFVKDATNPNTLNYFSVLLCRLAPTIAWQYLQQIGADGSEFEKVMGAGDVVMLRDWNVIAEPILTIAAMAMFAFRIPAKIASCFGREQFVVDYTVMVYTDHGIAERLLNRFREKKEVPPVVVETDEAPMRGDRPERDVDTLSTLREALLANELML